MHMYQCARLGLAFFGLWTIMAMCEHEQRWIFYLTKWSAAAMCLKVHYQTLGGPTYGHKSNKAKQGENGNIMLGIPSLHNLYNFSKKAFKPGAVVSATLQHEDPRA